MSLTKSKNKIRSLGLAANCYLASLWLALAYLLILSFGVLCLLSTLKCVELECDYTELVKPRSYALQNALAMYRTEILTNHAMA